jgi:hypothetical protein
MLNNKSDSNPWPWALSIVAVVAILIAIVAAVNSDTAGQTIPVQSTVSPDFASPEATVTIDPTATQAEQETLVALAATSTYEATTFPTSAPFPTGIHDGILVRAQLGREGFDVQNAWFGLLPDGQVWAYAGAPESDSDQGAIHVFLFRSNLTHEERFLTPDRHGALSIVSEANARLTLSSADGTPYYFDVPGMRFVSSLSDVVPSVTPQPTYTPVPVLPTGAPHPTGYPIDLTATSIAPALPESSTPSP